MLHPYPKPWQFSVWQRRRKVSELDGNEEGVRGKAHSRNFFEVIPSSLRENHLKNNIFSVSSHPHL